MPNSNDYQRVCAVCGCLFCAHQAHQKYCSRDCYRQQKRRNRAPRDCGHCGGLFAPTHGGALYCSEACKNAANRLKHRVRSRAYVARHPGRRKATLAEAWKRLRADPKRYAHFLAQGRESYARHPGTGYLYALNWRGANRDRVRQAGRTFAALRRERIRAVRGEVGAIVTTLRADPCSYCGGPGGVIDHIVPLAEGGTHEAANLTAACRRCNARKHTRSLLLFLLKIA